MKKIIYAVLTLLISFEANAQFDLSAEVRPRTEVRNGFKTPTSSGNTPAFFTEQRSRLNFDYKEEKYKFRLSLQDVRIWGETPQIFKEEDGNTYISEAWGQYFLSSNVSVKAGRQMLSYDNQRFLGGLEWAQQGRRHDAVVFMFDQPEAKSKLHLGIAFNSDDDIAEPANLQSPSAGFYSTPGNYKRMMYGHYNKKFNESSLSLLALSAAYQNPDSTTSTKQTLGAIGAFKLGSLTLSTDLYYQFGELNNTSVNALLAGVNIKIPTSVTPLTLGVEYISGTDDPDPNGGTAITEINNFSPDFGTNHAHNGLMDYFFVGPANGNVGVTDIYLKTKFNAGKGFLIANAHQFLTGSTQYDASGEKLSKAMGFELDLVYGVKLSPGVTFNAGISQLFATDTMLSLRPGDSSYNTWGWMMITFKPQLIKSQS